MILHRIDYNGGDIWVNKEAKIQLGDWVFELQPKDNIGDVHFINGEYVIANDIQHKIVAQSPNLSLPNIPYVQIEKNVEDLAYEYYVSSPYHDIVSSYHWLNGYKKASDKKYTEEYLIEFANWCRIHDNKHPNEVWTIQQLFDKYKSLQPKVVSIEVGMIQKGCCWNNPANCICEHKGENMRNNGFNGKLYDPTPVTYTKDGKTFLKVKNIIK